MNLLIAFILAMAAFIYVDIRNRRIQRRLLFLLGIARGQIDKRLADEFKKVINKL